MVSALLLCFLTEEEAFWALTTIVELCLPDYYTPGFFGLLVDQRGSYYPLFVISPTKTDSVMVISVMDELGQEYLGDLCQVLEGRGIPLVLICSAWFMALFVGFLPLEVFFPLPKFSQMGSNNNMFVVVFCDQSVLWLITVVFAEGPDSTVMFKVALAIFRLMEAKIRRSPNCNPIHLGATISCHQLIQVI